MFRYHLNIEGYPIAFGEIAFGQELDGTEPFSGEDINQWRKNLDGQWVRNYPELTIPESPILEYNIQSICPIDPDITRKAYWTGKIEATEDYFRIFTPILHFKNGERVTKYDTEVQTQVDRYTIIENPFNPGEMVNEYEFFVMITKNSVLITDAILMGMQKADLTGVFNTRVNYAV